MYIMKRFITISQIFTMGSARLSAALILVTVMFKVSFGQQCNLGNTQDYRSSNSLGIPPDQRTQKLFNMVSNTQATNCNSKPLTGLQQFLNYQNLNSQQSANSQPGADVQQSSNLNLPQSQSTIKKSDFYSLPLNLQAKILQQIQQIQGCSATNNNLERPEKSSSFQPHLGSPPVIHGQVSGLPSQFPQGLILSDFGRTSSVPSLTSNACNCLRQGQSTEQGIISPQSTVSTISNIVATSPTSAPEGYFTTKFIPISAIPLQNSIQQQTSYILPVSLENSSANQLQNNKVQSAATDKQNMPIQFAFHPVEQVQNQVQNQQPAKCIPSQQTPLTDLDPQALLTSLLLSQLGGNNAAPYTEYQTGPSNYPAASLPSLPIPNQGSKSSSVKALLPILLNMLKDKGDCGYHNNNNCGCFKDNQSNKELPQVNQFSHGQQQQQHKSNFEPTIANKSENVIGSKEQNSDKEKKEILKTEYRNNSAEDDEEDDTDSYEADDFEDEPSS